MTEKKSRLLLLVTSITIGTMLLVASLGVVDVIVDSYTSAYTTGYEEKQVSISSEETQFFKMNDITKDGIKDVEGELVSSSVLKHDKDDEEIIYVTLRGKQDKVITDKYNKYVLEGDVKELASDECIISKRISDERKISLGDTIKVSLFDKTLELKVAAICANSGLFYVDQKTQFSVVVTHKCLADFFEVKEDEYNVAFAKTVEDTIVDSIKKFEKGNKDTGFVAEALYTDEAISEQYQSFLISMYAMLAIVILTCFVIILGAFSLVINERLSTIGTFLSTGGTRFRIKFLLLTESVLYGVIGGILGDVLGVVVLGIVNRKVSPLAKYGIVEKYNVNVTYVICGFIFAIVLSLVSASIPVRKINKLPIKEVILNNFFVPVKVGWRNFIIGVILLGVSLFAGLTDAGWSVDYAPVFAVTVILGIILIAMKVIDVLSKLAGTLIKNASCTAYLAFNNLRTSRVLLSNAVLIMISLIASISISAVSSSIIVSLSAAYSELNYHASVTNIVNSDKEQDKDILAQEIRDMDIVEKDSVNVFYDLSGTIDNDITVKVLGVEPEQYKQYMSYLKLDSKKNAPVLDELKTTSKMGIVTSDKVLRALNKKKGDTVTLKLNGEKKKFEILGSIDGKMFCAGAFILTNKEKLGEAYGLGEPTCITLKFKNNNKDSLTKLKKVIVNYGATCQTKQEEKKSAISSMDTLCGALKIFSKIVIIISVFGIVNNMLVGLFQRKKELALLVSVGMNKAKKNRMLICESVITFFWSALMIVPYSWLLISLVRKFMEWTGLAISVNLDIKDMFITIGISFASIILVSLPILVKSSKISIMNELRYE